MTKIEKTETRTKVDGVERITIVHPAHYYDGGGGRTCVATERWLYATRIEGERGITAMSVEVLTPLRPGGVKYSPDDGFVISGISLHLPYESDLERAVTRAREGETGGLDACALVPPRCYNAHFGTLWFEEGLWRELSGGTVRADKRGLVRVLECPAERSEAFWQWLTSFHRQKVVEHPPVALYEKCPCCNGFGAVVRR